MAAAALAGATFGGPVGALAGAGAAMLLGDDKPKGKVIFFLRKGKEKLEKHKNIKT